MHPRKYLQPWFIGLFFFFTLGNLSLEAQTSEEENPIEVFWGEEDSTEYDTTYYDDEYYDDEYYDDEYYEDDTLGYDDYYDDEYYAEDSLYYDEYGDEIYADEEENPDIALADAAKNKGFTLSLTGASPGFVNHPLMTYNSKTDFRASLEFPLLLQMGGVRFRIGFEFGTFDFSNYLPAGGKISGQLYNGFLSFPAGPGQIRLGMGMAGGTTDFVAETTYGFAIGNAVELRAGVRATVISGAVNSKGIDLGTASWMDGMLTLGVTL